MSDSGIPRPVAEPGHNGADSTDASLGELRRLLLGGEQERIARIEKRLDDPVMRAEDIGRVLPHARIQKSLDQLIKSILKRDPELVTEVVKPIIFRSVRKAVTDALREFTESLEQIAEKSISLRALRWRFEALRTGRTFTEIVLAQSLLYSVREVFLIHGKTGVMLQQVTRQAVTKDADMISSMFTAIQAFVSDSFVGSESRELETIDLGSFKLWIQHGLYAMVVGAVSGSPHAGLKRVFHGALDEIETKFAPQFRSFQGDVTPFEAARPILERCLLGQSRPKPRRRIVPWLLAALVTAALIALAFIIVRDRFRWNNYLQKLGGEPGLVITSGQKRGSEYMVSGLRDEMARHPAALLDGTGLAADKVKFRLEPYLSLEPRFVAARNLAAQKLAIEKSVIRFAQAKSELTALELDHLDEIGAQLRSLLQSAASLHKSVHINVVGHTDEIGTEETNSPLSQDRADQVTAALAGAGIDRQYITASGVSTSQPLRTGSTERARSFNRSVSFRITEK
jgi:OOP family OmpA-OmpF porin